MDIKAELPRLIAIGAIALMEHSFISEYEIPEACKLMYESIKKELEDKSGTTHD